MHAASVNVAGMFITEAQRILMFEVGGVQPDSSF